MSTSIGTVLGKHKNKFAPLCPTIPPLVLYREGKHADCDKELAALEQNSKEAYALAGIKFTRALLADDSRAELALLDSAVAFLGRPQHEMAESERRVQLSAVLSERVRILSAAGNSAGAAAAARQIQAMAERHRDQAIEANSHTAQGYVLFVRGKFADAAQEFPTIRKARWPCVSRRWRWRNQATLPARARCGTACASCVRRLPNGSWQRGPLLNGALESIQRELRIVSGGALSFPALRRPTKKTAYLSAVAPQKTEELLAVEIPCVLPVKSLHPPAQVRTLPRREPVTLRGNPVITQRG